MSSKAREYIDFWIETSIHAAEPFGASSGGSQSAAILVARLIDGAKGEGIDEASMRAEVGDLTEYVGAKLAAANEAERGRSDQRLR